MDCRHMIAKMFISLIFKMFRRESVVRRYSAENSVHDSTTYLFLFDCGDNATPTVPEFELEHD